VRCEKKKREWKIRRRTHKAATSTAKKSTDIHREDDEASLDISTGEPR
jgi:hypothetical protein